VLYPDLTQTTQPVNFKPDGKRPRKAEFVLNCHAH